MTERQAGQKLEKLFLEGFEDYIGSEISVSLEEKGAAHHTTCSCNPQ